MSNARSEEHTSELQSRGHLVCRLLLEKKKNSGEVGAHAEHNLERDRPLDHVALVAPRFAPGLLVVALVVFFFNDTATTEIYTLSLHDALPISRRCRRRDLCRATRRPRPARR